MSVVPMHPRDTARERVAGEVRAHIARNRWSANRLAPHVGMTQSALSRRLTAAIPFDVDELEAIATVLGVDVAVFFGGDSKSPRPDGPDGGSVLPRLDSNQQPAGYEFSQVSALRAA